MNAEYWEDGVKKVVEQAPEGRATPEWLKRLDDAYYHFARATNPEVRGIALSTFTHALRDNWINLRAELAAAQAENERGYQMLSAYGVLRERAKDLGNGIDVLATRFGKEIAALKSWKVEQLAVEATWDEQAVGKALGLALGSPIRAQILPSIAALRQRLERSEKASKDGWTAFYKLRRWAAEHKFPGLDGVVSAALAAEPPKDES